MARRRRRESGKLRAICLDGFLLLWVGGMALRAALVVFAPILRSLEPLAVVLSAALRR